VGNGNGKGNGNGNGNGKGNGNGNGEWRLQGCVIVASSKSNKDFLRERKTYNRMPARY
jgi:hypothetical protein